MPRKAAGNSPTAERAEYRPAQIVRHFQRSQSVLLHLLPQIALARVRDQDHLVLPGCAQGTLEPVADQQVLGHGFNSAAGLAYADHHGFLRPQTVQQGLKTFGADIVRYPEPGARMAGAVLTGGKGLLHGARAQGGPAYAQQQHVAVALDARQKGGHFLLQGCPVGHVQKRQSAGGRFFGQTLGQLRRTGRKRRGVHGVKPVGVSSGPFEQMGHGNLLRRNGRQAPRRPAGHSSRKGLGAKNRRRTAL